MEFVFSQQAELDLEVERYEIEQRLQWLERFEREILSGSIPTPLHRRWLLLITSLQLIATELADLAGGSPA